MGHLFGGVRPSKPLYGDVHALLKMRFWPEKATNYSQNLLICRVECFLLQFQVKNVIRIIFCSRNWTSSTIIRQIE